MIPKIIHQTWKTKNLPVQLKKWHDQIKRLHPGWEIKLWTDEDNLALVKEHFPLLLNSYNTLQYNIMRVDLIRYIYMAIYGGYYLDLDYELFIPFDSKISDTELMLPLSSESGEKKIIGNSIFGSIPRQIFWRDILENFGKNPPTKKFSNKFEVLKLTGPSFISDIYFKAPNKYNGFLIEKNVFHPDNSLIKEKNYKKSLEQNGTRGIHHCQGSWLKENNSFINYISRFKSSMKRRVTNFLTS